MKHYLLMAVLALATVSRGASIGLLGVQHDDGASWRTATSNKVYDLDGNHVLGSDGYEVVNRPQAKPAYIGSMGILTGTYPGNGGYALIDDPTNLPATFVSGTMNPYSGTGVWTNMYTFTFNTNLSRRIVRVGLLVDNLDIAQPGRVSPQLTNMLWKGLGVGGNLLAGRWSGCGCPAALGAWSRT
jgi:hypothetical protein